MKLVTASVAKHSDGTLPPESDVLESPAGYIRGGTGVPTDSRRVVRILVGILLATLAVLAIVLTVAAAHQNTRRHRLQQYGVGVQVTVTSCVGTATGTGITVNGFTCRGSFTVNGRRYNEVIGHSDQLLTRGQIVPGVVDPASPDTLSTAAAVRATRADWLAYIPPAIPVALLVGAGCVIWRSRRRRGSEFVD